jgi:hypothetical protein
MNVLQRLRNPPLDGAIEWFNVEPPGPVELRGHIVPVGFA